MDDSEVSLKKDFDPMNVSFYVSVLIMRNTFFLRLFLLPSGPRNI